MLAPPRASRPRLHRAPLAALAALALAAPLLALPAGAPGPAGPSWELVLGGTAVYALGADASGDLVLAAGEALHLSRDAGAAWEHVPEGDGWRSLEAAASDAEGKVLYAGGQNMVFQPFVLASQDGGATWALGAMEIWGDGMVLAVAPHATEPGLAVAAVWYELADSEVVQTKDGGKSWERIAAAPEEIVDVAWLNPDAIVVATALGVGVVAGGGIEYATKDTGWVRSLAVHPDGPVVTGSSKPDVWRTEGPLQDLAPWAELLDQPAYDVALHPLDASQAWVVSYAGTLQRCDGACEDISPAATTYASLVTGAGQAFAASSAGAWRAAA